jgi:hypothetical protein
MTTTTRFTCLSMPPLIDNDVSEVYSLSESVSTTTTKIDEDEEVRSVHSFLNKRHRHISSGNPRSSGPGTHDVSHVKGRGVQRPRSRHRPSRQERYRRRRHVTPLAIDAVIDPAKPDLLQLRRHGFAQKEKNIII